MPIVLKSGSLDLLEPLGPVQACNGIALSLLFFFSQLVLAVFTPLYLKWELGKLPLACKHALHVTHNNVLFTARRSSARETKGTTEGMFATCMSITDTVYALSLSMPHSEKSQGSGSDERRNKRAMVTLSFSSLSYDRSKASSKASSPHSAIQSFLFQMRVSSPFLKVIQ